MGWRIGRMRDSGSVLECCSLNRWLGWLSARVIDSGTVHLDRWLGQLERRIWVAMSLFIWLMGWTSVNGIA